LDCGIDLVNPWEAKRWTAFLSEMWVGARNRVSAIDFGEDAESVMETLVSQRYSVYGAKAQLRT